MICEERVACCDHLRKKIALVTIITNSSSRQLQSWLLFKHSPSSQALCQRITARLRQARLLKFLVCTGRCRKMKFLLSVLQSPIHRDIVLSFPLARLTLLICAFRCTMPTHLPPSTSILRLNRSVLQRSTPIRQTEMMIWVLEAKMRATSCCTWIPRSGRYGSFQSTCTSPIPVQKQDNYAVLGLSHLRYKANEDQIKIARTTKIL